MDSLDPITRGGTWRLFLDTPGRATDWSTVPVEVYLDHESPGGERVNLRHLAGSAPFDGAAVTTPETGVSFVLPPAWTAARVPGQYRLTVALGGVAVRDVLPAFPRVLCRDADPLD